MEDDVQHMEANRVQASHQEVVEPERGRSWKMYGKKGKVQKCVRGVRVIVKPNVTAVIAWSEWEGHLTSLPSTCCHGLMQHSTRSHIFAQRMRKGASKPTYHGKVTIRI